MKTLGPHGIDLFEGRAISAETAVRFGIYTARRAPDGAVIPDSAGNIVVFPFAERGRVVAEKYRAPPKQFWQRAGGRRTFWNSDTLDDPGLASGYLSLVITEGELDALTAIDCGFPTTVSVPDGAPSVPDNEDPEGLPPLDATTEATGKFEFIWNNRDRLRDIKRFIIAVDNDRPGRRLAAELVRRLSASRCLFVEYPVDCKDLSDVRVRHGAEAVAQVLNAAKPYPVHGLYRLSEYPDEPEIQTFSTGWWTLDDHLKMFVGELLVVTGVPSHGKSTWTLNLLANAARLHGWRSAVFSPEMPTVPQLRDKLRRILSGHSHPSPDTDALIEDRFVFIDADPERAGDNDITLDWVIDRATDAVLRDGINVLLIDPWNEIEHARRRDESLPEYIGRSLRALKKFAKRYGVSVIVIAHPTKDVVDRTGKVRTPTLYDIDGAAHWFNKCDHGVVIERAAEIDESTVWVMKSRFEEAGTRGKVRMRFNRQASRFELLQPAPAGEAG